MKLSTLRANPTNPRIIKDEKFQKLVKSIEEFPEMLEARPIVVNPEMVVIGGNMRFKACKAAGLKEAPVYMATWGETKDREFIIKDNVSSGENDFDILANEWDAEELNEWGLDVWTGEPEETEGLTDPDDVPEVPEEPKTKLGDLYILGEHRLLCGDSTKAEDVEKLMNGERADMVFTSPPYNANTTIYEATGSFNDKNKIRTDKTLYLQNKTDKKTSSEYIQFNRDVFERIKEIASGEMVILYNINYNRNSPDLFLDVIGEGRDLFSLVETIVWEKSMAISLAGDNLTRIVEFIFVLYNGEDKPKINKTHSNECIKNLWKISNVGANNEIHKACSRFGYYSDCSRENGRKCYGMELDPKYCDVIVKRWEDFTGKKASKQ
jgi:DNA modification methylase